MSWPARLIIAGTHALFRECLASMLNKVGRFHVTHHTGDLEDQVLWPLGAEYNLTFFDDVLSGYPTAVVADDEGYESDLEFESLESAMTWVMAGKPYAEDWPAS